MYLPAMLLLLLAAPASESGSRALSDYSGRWVLDPSNGANAPEAAPSELIIGVDGKHLSLLRPEEGRQQSQPVLYRVDGKETVSRQVQGLIVVTTTHRLSVLDGDAALELTLHVEFDCRRPGPGTTCVSQAPAATSTERLELVGDGRGLRASTARATLLYGRAPSR